MSQIIGDGITFDDVLLVPQYSEVTPNMIDLTTHLTKKIQLNIPMMSAGMDTVTEHRMAIAIARQGGIGIIHINLSHLPLIQGHGPYPPFVGCPSILCGPARGNDSKIIALCHFRKPRIDFPIFINYHLK